MKAAPQNFARRSVRAGLVDDDVVGGRLRRVRAAHRLAERERRLVTGIVAPAGEIGEPAAQLGADGSQCAAGVLDRERARGASLVRRRVGVARPDDDHLERHVELLGCDLRGGDENALAELHFAGPHDDPAAFKDTQSAGRG
jgi:hypothetical protein